MFSLGLLLCGNMNEKEEILNRMQQHISEEKLDSIIEINKEVNVQLNKTHKILIKKYIQTLGREKFYQIFAATLKTAFCDIFLESLENKPSKQINEEINLVLKDSLEYMTQRVNPIPSTETHP